MQLQFTARSVFSRALIVLMAARLQSIFAINVLQRQGHRKAALLRTAIPQDWLRKDVRNESSHALSILRNADYKAASSSVQISSWHEDPSVLSWSGRLGNNIAQVIRAIIFAEAEGYQSVLIKPTGGHLHTFFNLPPYISIDANPDVKTRVRCPSNCPKSSLGDFYKCHCNGTTRADFRRVLMKYLKPKLNLAARKACDAEGHGFSGLTIHLRSGDLVKGRHPQGRFLPCSFHDLAIEEGGYKEVRVITESDFAHPCLSSLEKNHPTVRVQSKSVEEDACALMTAHHLEFGVSTFAFAMSLMNENVKSISMPGQGNGEITIPGAVGGERDNWGTLVDCRNSKATRTIRYTLYNVIGGVISRFGNDKVQWMHSFPASSLYSTTHCE